MGVDGLGVRGLDQQIAVVVGTDSHEHPGAAALQGVGGLPGVLQRGPAHLQQQSLLGIHRHRLAGCDAEEGSVEAIDVVHESPPAGRHLARSVGIGIEEALDIPTVARNLGNGVHPAPEQPPEGLRIVGTAGKATTHADDRNRL
jgi:hypothetical protein